MNRITSALALCFVVILSTPRLALGEGADPCLKKLLGCGTTHDGAYLGLSREEVRNLPKFPGDKGETLLAAEGKKRPVYDYQTLPNCSAAVPGSMDDNVMCTGALQGCPPDTPGPLSMIWRRTMLEGKEVAPWARVGVTCYTDVAPGARPTISMADILAQFMRTPWAKPMISSQPVGNVTLVNLKTFYQVNWSREGFEPGEVDTSNLLGVSVQIRPKLLNFTYVFGDGERFGPTISTGGVYPDGDVTHTYRQRGRFPVHVETTWGADFSLDGSTWAPIPDTVTVAGPATTITVREARAVLVNE